MFINDIFFFELIVSPLQYVSNSATVILSSNICIPGVSHHDKQLDVNFIH